MAKNPLTAKLESYLAELCVNTPDRHMGSQGNRRATDFVARTLARFGFQTECPEFDCLDWEHGGVVLTAGGESFAASISPYSPPCRVTAPLVQAATVEELAKARLEGCLVLLHSDLTRESLMPKNFPFYQPEEHLKIISLLEEGRPAAVIAATSRNPMAGGVYPAPMFEDGDFDVPSVCVTEEEGRRLLKYAGQPATLTFEARRLSSRGCNVIARRGEACSSRVVFCAHIDTKFGTPGALDNAAGVATLLGLAEVLSDYSGKLGLEIVALNGEEYYAAAGEVQYLNRSAGNLQEVLLGVNLDGVGHRDGKTAYSRYDCPDQLSAVIQESLVGGEYVEGDPWYQGDHMLFVQSQRPALALISANWPDFLPLVLHTDADRPELVDCSKLAEVARGLGDLFRRLEREGSRVG